jgi:hypothetical protein
VPSNRRKNFEDVGAIDVLLLREKLGLQRYVKQRERDPEKRRILLELAMKRICEAEQDDFIPVGYRRRRVKC